MLKRSLKEQKEEKESEKMKCEVHVTKLEMPAQGAEMQ